MRLLVALLLVLAAGGAAVLYVPGAETAVDDTTTSAVEFAANVTTDATLDTAHLEDEIHEEVNEERRARGLEPLERRGELDTVARGHSRDLLGTGTVGHIGSDGSTVDERVRRAGVNCRAGENVAMEYFDRPVRAPDGDTEVYRTEEEAAESVVARWMSSEGHRENILRESFTTQGIGVAADDEKGETRIIVTQVFC